MLFVSQYQNNEEFLVKFMCRTNFSTETRGIFGERGLRLLPPFGGEFFLLIFNAKKV